MKILILSDIHSTHTKRWVKSLSEKGCQILLFGLLDCDNSFYADLKNVTVYNYGFSFHKSSRIYRWTFGKILYFKSLKKIKEKIREFKPDIVHAHYASSYGLLGALTKFHPYIVSVWGSDVYSYPQSGCIYRRLLKYTFKKADLILSTSHCMAQETNKYTDKEIGITPFGVDTELFKPSKKEGDGTFVIGNVKTLSANYGIDLLIRAFVKICANNPDKPLKLRIVGDGPDKTKLQELSRSLGVESRTEFVGFVDNRKLPEIYNSFDVSVSLSYKESFGVVAVEAMVCGCPVVTSDADGFCEVVEDGVTGYIVPKGNVEAAAAAIQKYIDNPELRTKMGTAGRKRVLELYDWNDNVQTMISYYKSIVSKKII